VNSLHARLLVAASLVLAAFLGVTAVALERAYRDALLANLGDKLQSHVYTLLAAAEEAEGGRMRLPRSLPDPRLNRPGSGLLAWVLDEGGKTVWRSPSLLGAPPVQAPPQPPGRRLFRSLPKWLLLSQGIAWEDDAGRPWPFTIVVAQERAPFERGLGRFRTTLWRWLGGLAAGLLLVQLLLLRWGLAPLRELIEALGQVRKGERTRIDKRPPRELQPLVEALNALLEQGRATVTRYRHALDDLAHSLKTPLAHLQSLAEDETVECRRLRATMQEEVGRMENTVQHQLARAAASGKRVLGEPVAVVEVARRLAAALEKVYRAKGIAIELQLDDSVRFQGDPEDLMELLGNLLDNACKYGRRRVRLTATEAEGLQLVVEDDGAGIPEAERERVLQRGVRIDERQPGQGVGLATASDLARLYGGRLELGESRWGGARVVVWLPA